MNLADLKPKTEATQTVLSRLYESADNAADYADVLFFATATQETADHMPGLSTVVGDLRTQLEGIRDALHDLIAWP